MAKIRVRDLARLMGLQNQDLLFKLRAIGVRVDNEDAAIDREIIEAILHGKKLRQPREVILRDDAPAAAGEAPLARRPPLARPPASPLRPARRTMIQTVEPRIRTLPGRDRPPIGPPVYTRPEPAPALAREELAAAIALPTAAHEAVAVGVEVAVAAQVLESRPVVETRVAPPRPVETRVVEARAPEARPAEPRPADVRRPGVAPTSYRPGAPRAPLSRPPMARPPMGRPTPRPGELRPPASRPSAPGAPAGLDRRPGGAPGGAPAGDRRDRPGIDRRPAERRGKPPALPRVKRPGRPGELDDAATSRRAAVAALRRIPGTEEAEEDRDDLRPTSARGRRRSERKQEVQATGGVEFRGEKPTAPVTFTRGITVREFAEKLGVKAKDLIQVLFRRGVMATINHALDPEVATDIALELGIEAMEVTFEEQVQLRNESVREVTAEKAPRAPVVTVMGHVDHGKTTLLDAIRQTEVAAGEAGGITQHIAAYHVDVGAKKVVFLDTPGHEAFTMMRARGAKVTDIVVLVVAADDGVMPQTLEAIDHARAAKVPMVIAINKVDKPNANLDRVKKELADNGLLVEDWGGQTVAVPISALKKQGIDELLEMILLTADLLELRAAPTLPAQGVVIEARKEIGRGTVATVLVQDGTLHTGDVFVAGAAWGRVRSMADDRGERIQEALPSTPVEVTGFDDLPSAGDALQVVGDEAEARQISEFRRREGRIRDLAPQKSRMSLEQLFDKIQQDEVKELAVIVKADVQGSVEVLRDTLQKASTDKVQVKVIHAALGAVSTNDVILASASNAVIFGFNVRPERNAALLAEKEEVEIRLHTVIYELVDELKKAMAGLLEPTFEEVHKGTAQVRQIFSVPKVGVIAGCHVVDGVIPRSASVRLLRDNVVVYEGKIASLRRFKDDASEVRSGFDCGIGLERFQDVKPGDEIEAYAREEVAAVL